MFLELADDGRGSSGYESRLTRFCIRSLLIMELLTIVGILAASAQEQCHLVSRLLSSQCSSSQPFLHGAGRSKLSHCVSGVTFWQDGIASIVQFAIQEPHDLLSDRQHHGNCILHASPV